MSLMPSVKYTARQTPRRASHWRRTSFANTRSSDFAEYAHMAAMRSYDELGDWDGAHEMAAALFCD
ncbi:MAG: hypothetical protein WKF84_02555 [Pyrinomonadaceae bacterium]